MAAYGFRNKNSSFSPGLGLTDYLGTERLIVLQEYKKSKSTRFQKSCFTEDILISDAKKNMAADQNCEAPANLKKQIAYLHKRQWPMQRKHEARKLLSNLQLRYHQFTSDQKYNGDNNSYAKISNLFISQCKSLNEVHGGPKYVLLAPTSFSSLTSTVILK